MAKKKVEIINEEKKENIPSFQHVINDTPDTSGYVYRFENEIICKTNEEEFHLEGIRATIIDAYKRKYERYISFWDPIVIMNKSNCYFAIYRRGIFTDMNRYHLVHVQYLYELMKKRKEILHREFFIKYNRMMSHEHLFKGLTEYVYHPKRIQHFSEL